MNKQFDTGTLLLNKYQIENVIGRGGSGEVYKATDIWLKRPVAIKTLRADSSERYAQAAYEEVLTRFRNEAQISSYFTSNPNIITVYGLEQDETNSCYLILEYLAGGSLASLLRENKQLSLEQACQIILNLTHALHEVHTHPADIIHRDIKPSNILLRANSEAVLADFGIAQIGSQSKRTEWRGQRSHPGTPTYSSPEQLTSAEYLSIASDMYNVGLLLYEALTGQPYARVRVLPPSVYRPGLPSWVDQIVVRLLQETREERYWEAEQLGRDIEHGLNGRLTATRRFLTNTSRHRENTTPTKEVSAVPFETKLEELHQALEETMRILPALHTQTEPVQLQIVQQTEHKTYDLFLQVQSLVERSDWNAAIELGTRFLQVEPGHPAASNLLAWVYWVRGLTAYQMDQLEAAEIDYRKALELNPLQSRFYASRAELYYRRRQYLQALSDLAQAIELDRDQADYYITRSQVYQQLKQFERAVENADEAVRLDPTKAFYYYIRALSYYQMRDYHLAIADLNRAITRDYSQSVFYYQRGLAYEQRGLHFHNKADQDHAGADFRQAIQLDPKRAVYYFSAALYLVQQKQLELALDRFKQAIELDNNQALFYYHQGITYFKLHQADQAIKSFSQAGWLAPNQPEPFFYRGMIYKTGKNRKAAQADLKHALELGYEPARPGTG